MCFGYSSPRRASTSIPTARSYDPSVDGPRTQENAILYALNINSNGRTVDQLRDTVRTVQNRIDFVPTPSIRRAIGGLRVRGYHVSVSDGNYRLV